MDQKEIENYKAAALRLWEFGGWLSKEFPEVWKEGGFDIADEAIRLLTELKNRRAMELQMQAHAHLVQDEVRDVSPEAIRAFNDVVKTMKESHPDSPQLLREPISTKYPGCDCGAELCTYPGSFHCRKK